MNHRTWFKSVVLSSLLVSAVGVPAVTNAAEATTKPEKNTTTSAQPDTVKATKAVFVPFANPLELARTYAPDTLKDWESTLKRYQELNVITAAAAPPDVTGTAVQTTKAAVKLTKALEASESVNVDKIKTVDAVKEGKALKVAYLSPDTVEAEAAVGGLNADGTLTVTGGLKDLKGTETVTLPAASTANALFNAHIDLAKTAESKDAAAIRDTLGKLLALYKEQIAKLEASK